MTEGEEKVDDTWVQEREVCRAAHAGPLRRAESLWCADTYHSTCVPRSRRDFCLYVTIANGGTGDKGAFVRLQTPNSGKDPKRCSDVSVLSSGQEVAQTLSLVCVLQLYSHTEREKLFHPSPLTWLY